MTSYLLGNFDVPPGRVPGRSPPGVVPSGQPPADRPGVTAAAPVLVLVLFSYFVHQRGGSTRADGRRTSICRSWGKQDLAWRHVVLRWRDTQLGQDFFFDGRLRNTSSVDTGRGAVRGDDAFLTCTTADRPPRHRFPPATAAVSGLAEAALRVHRSPLHKLSEGRSRGLWMTGPCLGFRYRCRGVGRGR